jgi:hypothetical protein
MSFGDYSSYIAVVPDVLSQADALWELGFEMEDVAADDEDQVFVDDQLVALTCVDLVRNTMFEELIHMMYHSHRPPCAFAGLLSRSDDRRSERLQWCKQLSESLCLVEAAAQSDHVLRSYLADLLWPGTCFSREVLVGLSEASFEEVPPDIKEDLVSFVSGWSSSVPCENTFKLLRSCARQHTAGMLGRISRWHRIIASSLMEDHDRKLPTADCIARFSKASTLANSTFEAKARQNFSLGNEVLDNFGIHD